MEIEKQVCSLELAKRLKELGVKQESYFTWCINSGKAELLHNHSVALAVRDKLHDFEGNYSAFTVAELGILLPEIIYSYKREYFYEVPVDDGDVCYSIFGNGREEWYGRNKPTRKLVEGERLKLQKQSTHVCAKWEWPTGADGYPHITSHMIFESFAQSEADARAKALIYAIENKLVNP